MQRTRWQVALLAACALLVAACGRGGDDAADEAENGLTVDPDAEEEVLEVEEEPAEPEPEPVTYEVQDGDTLSSIASQHDVSIDAIVAANGLDDPDAIFPGDVLEIPDAGDPDDDASAGDTPADAAPDEDADDEDDD